MARRTRCARCLELRCLPCSRWTTSGDFCTTSAPSVRISSMWQGLDLKLCQSLVLQISRQRSSHVRVDATVSTVCASPLLGRLVDLNVLDDQVLRVQPLGIRIRLGVLEQAREELGRLDGPAGLADTELLACATPSISICILPTVLLQCILARDSLIPCDGHTYLGQYGQCSQHSASWARLRRGS